MPSRTTTGLPGESPAFYRRWGRRGARISTPRRECAIGSKLCTGALERRGCGACCCPAPRGATRLARGLRRGLHNATHCGLGSVCVLYVYMIYVTVVGREVGQAPRRQRTASQRMEESRTGGGQPPNTAGGKHHTGGNSPQGNPTRQHPPHRKSSTRREPRGRGGRRSSDFRVKQMAPPTAGSCSHRVAEKLYAGSSIFGLPRETKGTPHCWLV